MTLLENVIFILLKLIYQDVVCLDYWKTPPKSAISPTHVISQEKQSVTEGHLPIHHAQRT